MTADKLAFLDDEGNEDEIRAAHQEVTDDIEEPAPEPEPEKPTGDDAAPPAEHEEPGKTAPIAALQAEREKRKEFQREVEDLKRQMQDLHRSLQPKEKKPDFFENPEAVLTAQHQQWQQSLVAERLKQSRFLAEREFGKETVEEAYRYFDQHPAESQALINEPSPFHAAVEHFKRAKLVSEIGTDPEAFKARLREEVMAEIKAQPTRPAAPPRSLASAPSAGGETNKPGSGFDAVFGD